MGETGQISGQKEAWNGRDARGDARSVMEPPESYFGAEN